MTAAPLDNRIETVLSVTEQITRKIPTWQRVLWFTKPPLVREAERLHALASSRKKKLLDDAVKLKLCWDRVCLGTFQPIEPIPMGEEYLKRVWNLLDLDPPSETLPEEELALFRELYAALSPAVAPAPAGGS